MFSDISTAGAAFLKLSALSIRCRLPDLLWSTANDCCLIPAITNRRLVDLAEIFVCCLNLGLQML